MSNLRLIALLVGLTGLVGTFLFFRGPKWRRSSFVLLTLINLGLVGVSLRPDAVNFLQDLLSLQQYQRGRLIALLIMTVLFLLFFSLYSASKIERLRVQFDHLVRHLGSRDAVQVGSGLDRQPPVMVLLPAYNEAANLEELLPRMPRRIGELATGVLVVDDGSSDGTREVARRNGVAVACNPINRGGGAALRLGFDILRHAGTQICVTMDADGQHRPEDIPELVRPLLTDTADIVIGSRILGSREKDSLTRLAGVHLFGRLITALLGRRITDPSSGFRAFRVAVLQQVHLTEDQYHTSEMIFEAVKRGLRVTEVPIRIMKRRHGRSKKGRDWKYGLFFAKTIVKAWWRQIN